MTETIIAIAAYVFMAFICLWVFGMFYYLSGGTSPGLDAWVERRVESYRRRKAARDV